jgi:hypothetical protein
MAFVLAYSKGVGIENCWNWWVIENAIYIVGEQAPTQVQMPMLWEIMGKQISVKLAFLGNTMPKCKGHQWFQAIACCCEGITNYKHAWGDK